MTLDLDQVALDRLDQRLRILLPEQYQGSYERVAPVSMGSAGLKFDADGNVAWDEIWQTFCDLAMAGGPPHKGALLEPGRLDAIAANREQYDRVVDEICRGVTMAADLPTQRESRAGWIQVHCHSATMADWLARAIVMENVSAHATGVMLYLPAAPHFRLEKEIKNVITVIAKTTHYWTGHMSRSQKTLIADLFVKMGGESPVIEPPFDRAGEADRSRVADQIAQATTLLSSSRVYDGWLGLECATVKMAVWMMRALAAYNVLARREDTTLFVPLNADHDPDGRIVASAVGTVHRLYQKLAPS